MFTIARNLYRDHLRRNKRLAELEDSLPEIVWLFLDKDPTAGVILAAVAVINWIGFFYQRWKARSTD